MECRKTNLSLDTLLILDCEEKIKSEKHGNHSRLDKLILSCEKLKRKKHHRHHKSKSEHRYRREEQKKKCADCVRTKFVTQEIHVEQQNYKCIINFNASVCDHKNGHERIQETKSLGPKSNCKERPVPHCLRQLCRGPGHHNIRFHSKNHYKTDSHRIRRLNRVNECIEKSKHGNHNHRQHSRHEKKPSKEELIPKYNDLKTISQQSKQLELTYEDISNKSMNSYLEVPVSYKHVAKNSRGQHYESKLDTLIKRTKERERKLVEQSRNIPWYTSTPAYSEVSSVDFPISCSDVNISIHSQSTLILEPRDHGYSPSIEGFCHSRTIERYLQYSPKPTIGSYSLPNIVEQNNFALKIKMEPTTDIGAYSPTQSPDSKEFDMEQAFQNEIKIEPKVEK